MKTNYSFLLFFLITTSFFSFNCFLINEQFGKHRIPDQQIDPLSHFRFTIIADLDTQILPDSGYYYIYTKAPDEGSIISPLAKLDRLVDMGINIDLAIYRSAGPCHQYGDRSTTDTIYPEYFIIHLTNDNSMVENSKFRPIPRPMHISCKYSITVFIPKI